ncbi:hypothetical protein AB0M48_24520 [Lentzea sp. NPDC051208]|uniref:hypothetical protein n=1 Tax=Lentzea sp. NPDC051208 TaxID=3154642 RepID=UPI003414D03B
MQDVHEYTHATGVLCRALMLLASPNDRSGQVPRSVPSACDQGPTIKLVELARGTLEGFDSTHHAASGPLVRLSGGEAECRVHVIAYHHVPAAPGVVDFCTICPWEGSPDVYALAAERIAPQS